MSTKLKLRAYLLSGAVAPVMFGAISLATSGAAVAAPCTGAGAPTTTQTKCLTAVTIPGNPLRSFDISWVNPRRAEYYLADRSNAGIDIIDTETLTFKRRIGGFAGIVLNGMGGVDNNRSGPDGVVSFGKCLYAGDAGSLFKVFDLNVANPVPQIINTGGSFRVDEMAVTSDGEMVLAANNADDPPFGTLFTANGDDDPCHATFKTKITVASSIIPTGFGLSIEQPAWDPTTKRFYVSIPVIANNPTGCNYGQVAGAITCDGGLLVVDPTTASLTPYGAFDPVTNTGVVALHSCGPNGATRGPHDNLLLGCTPQNNPSNTTTLVINAKAKNYANIAGITGSDEVWFNKGDGRYYTGSSRQIGGAVLGVIDATSVLIETIPQSTGSHSVAADSRLNRIFVPQVAPKAVVGIGGDTTTVGAGICGGNSGCVAVYQHDVDEEDDGR
jgi:hypothetical protein